MDWMDFNKSLPEPEMEYIQMEIEFVGIEAENCCRLLNEFIQHELKNGQYFCHVEVIKKGV